MLRSSNAALPASLGERCCLSEEAIDDDVVDALTANVRHGLGSEGAGNWPRLYRDGKHALRRSGD